MARAPAHGASSTPQAACASGDRGACLVEAGRSSRGVMVLRAARRRRASGAFERDERPHDRGQRRRTRGVAGGAAEPLDSRLSPEAPWPASASPRAFLRLEAAGLPRSETRRRRRAASAGNRGGSAGSQCAATARRRGLTWRTRCPRCQHIHSELEGVRDLVVRVCACTHRAKCCPSGSPARHSGGGCGGGGWRRHPATDATPFHASCVQLPSQPAPAHTPSHSVAAHTPPRHHLTCLRTGHWAPAPSWRPDGERGREGGAPECATWWAWGSGACAWRCLGPPPTWR